MIDIDIDMMINIRILHILAPRPKTRFQKPPVSVGPSWLCRGFGSLVLGRALLVDAVTAPKASKLLDSLRALQMAPGILGFPNIRGPNMDPQILELLRQKHPKKDKTW